MAYLERMESGLITIVAYLVGIPQTNTINNNNNTQLVLFKHSNKQTNLVGVPRVRGERASVAARRVDYRSWRTIARGDLA